MAKIKWIVGEKTKEGNYNIFIQLSHRGERKKRKTGISLKSDEFVKRKDGTIKIKSGKKKIDIDSIVNKLEEKLYIVQKTHFGKNFSADELFKMIITPIEHNKLGIDFFSYTEKWLEHEKIKGVRNYKSMLNSLAQYNKSRYLPFEKIDVKFLNGYLTFLNGKERAQSLYLGAIRHIYKQAVLEYNTDEQIILSPMLFERFKVPKQRLKGQRAISLETLRKIIEFQGTGRAALARDCFVLSFMLMGMNSADMYDSDAKIKEGKICYRRKKVRDRRTDEAYIEVVIPKCAKELIAKYKGKSRVFDFHIRYCDEVEFNRAINIGLKKIKKEIGIDNLQFYQARHTWATIARNDLHIDKYLIHECLNHLEPSTRIDDVYIKKDYKLINEANFRVIDYVFGTEQK